MRKLIYSNFQNNRFDLIILLFRITIGLSMGFAGLNKLTHFSENAVDEFWVKEVNFLWLGGSITVALVIFSELVCSILLMFGFLTRLSTIPLIVTALVILYVHDFKVLEIDMKEGYIGLEAGFSYLVYYVMLLFSGPGKYSLDHRFFKD